MSQNVRISADSTRLTTLMLLRHLISLVGDGVAQLVFQYSVVHVECLYCKHWKFHRILA